MAKTVEVLEQKFYNQFKNGQSFTQNLDDFSRNLAGSVGETIRLVTKINLSWRIEYIAQDGDPSKFEWIYFWNGDQLTIERTDGGDFRTEGFAVGQAVRFAWFTTVFSARNVSIVQILESSITLDMDGIFALTYAPGGISIDGIEPITALQYDFGLIENDENYNNTSKVTDNSMSYYAAAIGPDNGSGVRSTARVQMQSLGPYKDFVTGNAFVNFDGILQSNDFVKQVFVIEHTFIINPLSVQAQNQNLIDRIAPDYLSGDASLKYVFNADFRQVLNNPNINYPVRLDETLGSVAWFDEAFNGFNNNYQVNSISYEQAGTGNPADGILIDSRTKITIVVSKKSGSFNTGDQLGIMGFLLAQENQYLETVNTNLEDNFIYDNAFNVVGTNVNTGNDWIKLVSNTLGGGLVTIEVETEFSIEQQQRISQLNSEGLDDFLIAVQMGDKDLSNGNSDRAIVIADITKFDDSPDILGLVDVQNFRIYPHNEKIGVGTFYTEYTGWNEDGILVSFQLDVNLLKQASINSAALKLVAYNPTTEDTFELDSYELQLNSVLANGVQQINIQESRGYNLKDTDQFNRVTVLNAIPPNANTSSYLVIFGQKIKWQDWLENLNVPTSFFDSAKPNNNRNFKSSNYSEQLGYEIRAGIALNMFGVSDLGVSGNTDYLVLSPKLRILDYEVGPVNPANWTCVIETFRESNGANLQGAILTTENTIFKSTWSSIRPIGDFAGVWGIHRIEETNDTGDDIDELSSIDLPPANNRLIPLSGQTLLSVSQVGSTIEMTCLIDHTKLDPSKTYNLTSRIGEGIIPLSNLKVTSPAGASKELSGSAELKEVS